jgi:glutamate N-acetyltransferase/amino-acid N-acetyltransferase
MTRNRVKTVNGGITAPLGFLAAGMHAGIKKPSIPDLALIASMHDGPIAGVLTRNRVAAAPVVLTRRHLARGIGRAIIVNSGNANACTGRRGLADALETARLVARSLRTDVRKVFVGSTGVIGQFLPMDRLRPGIPRLVGRLRRTGGRDAARAILTTDKRVKEIALQARIGGRVVTVGGMAKGSGMIHPDMATMLAYVTTDAAITTGALRTALRQAVAPSFNCISVDGDTSTNDTVLCLANGRAGNPLLRAGSRDLAVFQELLDQVCRSLALQVCRDGEGVTKVVRILVTGARSEAEARLAARAIGTSCLVKTALFGEDANWGRIMAAIGRSGANIRPERIGLAFDGVPIVKKGASLGPSAERRIAPIARRREFTITADLGSGQSTAQIWTTDLSYEYVKINASYRS